MSKRAFFAKLWLDLDSGFVDLHMHPFTVRCLDCVYRLHGNRAFGLVSLGRFAISIHNRDEPSVFLNLLPTFVKVGGGWMINGPCYDVICGATRINDLVDAYASFKSDPATVNRGPVLTAWRSSVKLGALKHFTFPRYDSGSVIMSDVH